MDASDPGHERRRESERRSGVDRRRARAARGSELSGGWRESSWSEQVLQFVARYVFIALGFAYFNVAATSPPTWLSHGQLNGILAAYVVWNSALLLHAWRRHYSPVRLRIAMWGDILGISLCVLADPNPMPVSAMVYIMIVLGNGMRYGMQAFLEALASCFVLALIALGLRYTLLGQELLAHTLFLYGIGALILIYSYLLMGRVEASRRTLEESSRRDPLTMLTNRAALLDVADRLLEPIRDGGGRLVVMFADLDRFKTVNDTLGHSAGDRVLCQVSKLLRESIRETDVVARYGGDEFVMLLRDAAIEQAEGIAQRIQDNLAVWSERSGVDISVTIGLGEAPRHGTELPALIHRVDEALYTAKARGQTSGICTVVG